MCQIAGCVGQQNVKGQRIPFLFRGRTLPCFSNGDQGVLSRGFISSSYVKGLRPAEFFFHAMAGREGLIDTACKTSTTGYTERKLVKSLEDLRIEYDGTVRRGNGNIVQFVYGDDGFDATYLRTVRHPLHHQIGCCPEETLEMKEALHRLGLKPRLQPFCIPRILQLLRFWIPEPDIKANAQQIYTLMKQLRNKLSLPQPTLDYLILACSSTHLLQEHQLLENELPRLCTHLEITCEKISISPGEMVGVLAAQSIAEPATQMTLNTFHFTGISSKNITLGIPRLLELLSCTKKPKCPILRFQTSSPITHVRLRDVVQTVEWRYHALPIKDHVWFHLYQKFIDKRAKVHGRWIIRITVDPEQVTPVLLAIRTFTSVINCYSCPSGIILLVGTSRLSNPSPYVNMLRALRQFWTKLLPLTISGIPGISCVERTGKKIVCQGDTLTNVLPYDPFHAISNNPLLVHQTLGIEAARSVLLQELTNVLCFDGSYVNQRHLLLLVDAMTHTGRILPITRHGMTSTSVLKRCSFECATDVLVDGAARNLVDPLNGMSENILVGNVAPMGTGIITCLLDEDKCTRANPPHLSKVSIPQRSPFTEEDINFSLHAPSPFVTPRREFIENGYTDTITENIFAPTFMGTLPEQSTTTPQVPLVPQQVQQASIQVPDETPDPRPSPPNSPSRFSPSPSRFSPSPSRFSPIQSPQGSPEPASFYQPEKRNKKRATTWSIFHIRQQHLKQKNKKRKRSAFVFAHHPTLADCTPHIPVSRFLAHPNIQRVKKNITFSLI